MSLRRIPGTERQYFLISYDKHGDELPDPDGSIASEQALAALADPAAAVTDVFVLSHGWQGDYQDAISQYDRWLGAADPDRAGDGIRPFVIGLHWPSKAWSDRELASAPSGLLSDEPPVDGVTVDEAVEEYATLLGDAPELRAALRTVLAHAADVDPDQDADPGDELPFEVAEAYRVIAAGTAADDGDDPLLGGGWDPDLVFAEAATEQSGDDGLLGEGWFQKLREAILTPLRQLTFWHGKNQAREFGERGAARLLRAIMGASPARVHLLGHSFGTIVVSSAVRGPGRSPVPPPRPVDSLFLVQGAVSLWAFSGAVPQSIGGGRGYLADVATPRFVAGPIVATRSTWDYAVGKYYPLAVGIAGQYLLADELPKYGGIGTWGIQGLTDAVELPPLEHGARADDAFAAATVHNIDASEVISRLDGASGAHNDLAHPELVQLAWNAARAIV
ncbi:hypothetical protein [Microbacterium ulmi]|uniref:Serine-threonine protein kinase n=1 Tax=Microbacterium ulmi TaxID=179095 RepID=A0A7Y2Q094_9MICO|nr:hypothetical protein [Microbacterium ulmi]NII71076.1 hypothetical protein [Microbacterium ulmi]NNH02383.1 hypothetical protein [Microbacterium ulmi]